MVNRKHIPNRGMKSTFNFLSPLHRSIPVCMINFVLSYPKMKLEKEYFRKISPDGLKVKKRRKEERE